MWFFGIVFLGCEIIVKVEYFNFGGLVKDRVVFYFIKEVEEKGLFICMFITGEF